MGYNPVLNPMPVTGTFWQATQPISGTVSVSGSVAVTGTFWQTTQPVSIAATVAVSGPLTDTQLRATAVPVSGTFWQSTQPVSAASLPLPSGAAQDSTLTGGTQKAIARGGAKGSTTAADVTSVAVDANTQALHTSVTNFPASQAVTGTFWQATQPVSGTFWQATQPVSGTFWQATQPVSIAATVAVSGPLTDTQLRATAVPVSGTFWQATQPVSLASTVNVSVQNATLAVTAPTLTKGTQGANGFSVQDLKDSGRATLAMTSEFTFAQTAETLLTMTISSNGATTTTFTSRTITSGKRMRLQSAMLQVELLGSGTTPQRAYLRIRANTAGATTTSSPLQWILPCGVTTAIVKATNWASIDFPDGFELLGDGTATIGFTLETPEFVTTTATGRAKITIIGFEY